MTHTLQREMELDGLDDVIHMYALHPGRSTLTKGTLDMSKST